MEITKKEVEGLIEVERRDIFFNHLKTSFGYNNYIPFGEKQNNKILIWQQNFWNRMFYPIFTLEFNSKNHLININDRLNPIGRLLCYIAIILMIYILIPTDLFEWSMLIIKLMLYSLIILLSKHIYKTNIKDQLEQIYNQLDIEVEKTKPQNEWSLKNILIRLLMYPSCFLLLFFCFKWMIPNGEYFKSIFPLTIVGSYFYTDVKILLKK